ncbi:MAG: pentapeptide repeat-containing protein, partial [Planctomycetota bacterium]
DASFHNADLDDSDLSNATLTNADLSDANLSNADAASADFSNADLNNADLNDADLSDTDFGNADLSNASLRNADLYGADLTRVDAHNASFEDADLGLAGLRGADLSNADLSNADLSSANLGGADLNQALLINADLSHANLRGADLGGAKLGGADLDSTEGVVRHRLKGLAGDVIRDAGDATDRFTDALSDVGDSARESLSDVGDRAERAIDRAGEAIDALPERAGEAIEDLREAGGELVESGERVVREAGEAIDQVTDDLGEAARDGLDRARRAGGELLEAGGELVETFTSALDAEEQIGALDSDGDTVVYELGAFAQVELRGEVAGSAEVKRVGDGEDARYEVKISGEVGFGVIAELGGSAGGEAKAEAQAMLRAGGAVTMTFDTPEDAARAVGIAARTAAAGPLLTTAPMLAPVVGPSADDLRFMAENTTSVELAHGVSGELAASLGVGLDDGQLRLAGAGAKLAADVRYGARLTFPRDGNPARLTLTAQGTVLGGANVGLGLSETGGRQRGGGLGIGAGAQGQLQARAEFSFDLPQDVDITALMANPGEALLGHADRMVQSQEVKLTLSGSGRAHATLAGGVAAGFEVELTGRPAEIGQALQAVGEHGIERGLNELDESITLTGKTTTTRTHGWRLTPEISAMGVGVGITVAAERNDQAVTGTTTGHPSDVIRWLTENYDPDMVLASTP